MTNMYAQPYQQQRYPQALNNGIVWVQGIEGAKAYQLMPNSNTILMDSENDGRFYIKVADNVGMCTLRVFKYEEITTPTAPQPDMSQYVTRDELDNAIKKLLGDAKNEQAISTTQRKSTKSIITE